MFAIQRSDGLFLADGAVYSDEKNKKPTPIWQPIEGDRFPYLEEFLWNVTRRKERLEKIYTRYNIKVVKLSEDQLEYLTFRKLKGNVRD